MNLRAKFWANVLIPTARAACWEWQAGRITKGYGEMSVGGKKQRYAHRLAWEFTNGLIPAGMVVCHRCDNPACCRPSHLFLGTLADNNRDCCAKGRHVKGEAHAHAKLTEDIVRAIRADPRIHREVAEAYGVSLSNVGLIRQRKRWAWVEDAA